MKKLPTPAAESDVKAIWPNMAGRSVQHKAAYLLYAENQRLYDVLDRFAPTLDIEDAERLAHKAIAQVMSELDHSPGMDPPLEDLTPFWLYRKAQRRFVHWACDQWNTYPPEKKNLLAYWMAVADGNLPKKTTRKPKAKNALKRKK